MVARRMLFYCVLGSETRAPKRVRFLDNETGAPKCDTVFVSRQQAQNEVQKMTLKTRPDSGLRTGPKHPQVHRIQRTA